MTSAENRKTIQMLVNFLRDKKFAGGIRPRVMDSNTPQNKTADISHIEYYLFSQSDSRPRWYNNYVKYHQTTLFSTIGVGLDGSRDFTNVPCTNFLFDDWRIEGNVAFKYYVKGLKEKVLYDYDSHETISARERFEKYGMPQEWNDDGKYGRERYIEAQIWSDEVIDKYKEK